jgi:hypothetical protein
VREHGRWFVRCKVYPAEQHREKQMEKEIGTPYWYAYVTSPPCGEFDKKPKETKLKYVMRMLEPMSEG